MFTVRFYNIITVSLSIELVEQVHSPRWVAHLTDADDTPILQTGLFNQGVCAGCNFDTANIMM